MYTHTKRKVLIIIRHIIFFKNQDNFDKHYIIQPLNEHESKLCVSIRFYIYCVRKKAIDKQTYHECIHQQTHSVSDRSRLHHCSHIYIFYNYDVQKMVTRLKLFHLNSIITFTFVKSYMYIYIYTLY